MTSDFIESRIAAGGVVELSGSASFRRAIAERAMAVTRGRGGRSR